MKDTVPMEMLPINGDSGQSYGYILYRKKFTEAIKGQLQIVGEVRDRVQVCRCYVGQVRSGQRPSTGMLMLCWSGQVRSGQVRSD